MSKCWFAKTGNFFNFKIYQIIPPLGCAATYTQLLTKIDDQNFFFVRPFHFAADFFPPPGTPEKFALRLALLRLITRPLPRVFWFVMGPGLPGTQVSPPPSQGSGRPHRALCASQRKKGWFCVAFPSLVTAKAGEGRGGAGCSFLLASHWVFGRDVRHRSVDQRTSALFSHSAASNHLPSLHFVELRNCCGS